MTSTDWPLDDYRTPDHPLQQAIRTAVEDAAGEKVSYVAVDGCGAPILAISLAGLARSFGLFAAAAPGTLEARVADAFRAYPEYASGSTRDEAALMRGDPGPVLQGGRRGRVRRGPRGRPWHRAEDRGRHAARPRRGDGRRTPNASASTTRSSTSSPISRLYGGGVEVGAVQPVILRRFS